MAGNVGLLLIAMGFLINLFAIFGFYSGMSRGRGTIRVSRTGAWGKGSFLTQLLVVGTSLMFLGATLAMI